MVWQDEQGAVHLLLSPHPALVPAWDRLATGPVAWERVTIWPTDEAVVSEADPAHGWSRLWGHLAVPATFTGIGIDPRADASGERAAERLAAAVDAPPCRGVVDHAVLVLGPRGELAALSPDSPALYGLQARVLRDGAPLDEVTIYFGMRKIAMAKDAQGVNRLMLNNKPLFQFGTLDQGWWPDGLYTPAIDTALVCDMEMTKKFGMNIGRQHVKLEINLWY